MYRARWIHLKLFHENGQQFCHPLALNIYRRLFPEIYPRPQQISEMKSFATITDE